MLSLSAGLGSGLARWPNNKRKLFQPQNHLQPATASITSFN
ncbi:hypothetical protein [Paenibacillus alvei]|nr:hypothetical protein [Paenibacillus alvei]